MGVFKRTAADTMTIRTKDRSWTDAQKKAVKKVSDVTLVAGGGDVILGLRVRAAQHVSELILDGKPVTGYQNGQDADLVRQSCERTFGLDPGERWIGFAIPATDVPQSPTFESQFTITSPPRKPAFQVVPVVVAHSIREMEVGFYWLGASIVMEPNARATEMAALLPVVTTRAKKVSDFLKALFTRFRQRS
jgi:hypothetical protein